MQRNQRNKIKREISSKTTLTLGEQRQQRKNDFEKYRRRKRLNNRTKREKKYNK